MKKKLMLLIGMLVVVVVANVTVPLKPATSSDYIPYNQKAANLPDIITAEYLEHAEEDGELVTYLVIVDKYGEEVRVRMSNR